MLALQKRFAKSTELGPRALEGAVPRGTFESVRERNLRLERTA
jgi:hypothetical protein